MWRNDMPDQMLIRIENDIKERFSKIARSEGKSASQKIRELMEEYINDRDIASYVDSLWERVGNDLAARKTTGARISKAVRDSRKSR